MRTALAHLHVPHPHVAHQKVVAEPQSRRRRRGRPGVYGAAVLLVLAGVLLFT